MHICTFYLLPFLYPLFLTLFLDIFSHSSTFSCDKLYLFLFSAFPLLISFFSFAIYSSLFCSISHSYFDSFLSIHSLSLCIPRTFISLSLVFVPISACSFIIYRHNSIFSVPISVYFSVYSPLH